MSEEAPPVELEGSAMTEEDSGAPRGRPKGRAGRGRPDAPHPPAAQGGGEGEEGSAEPALEPRAEPELELESGAGEGLSDEELVRGIAALLFASPHPLSLRKLTELLERPRPARVQAALEQLARSLEAGGLPIELRRIAGGWHLFSAPDQGEVIARLAPGERTERLSAAGLETLAVVAYRQPVTKAEIEAIRGVQAGPMLRSLVDRGLVKVLGRADLPGNPLQYGTTREFLDRFGLGSLEDLPRDGELL